MRTALAITLLSSAVIAACAGRPEPHPDLLGLNADEVLIDDEDQERDSCQDLTRACLDPVIADMEIVPADPSYKSPDEIRAAPIGERPAIAMPGTMGDSPLVSATCQGEVFSHVGSKEPGIELHVISVHDAGDGGEVRVFVERQEAVALVLSSYQSTRWIVDNAVGARITEIVLNGHYDQDVITADHIAVTQLEGEQSLGSFATGVDEKGREGTTKLMDAAKEATGVSTVRSFHGCASGNAFVLAGS